MYLFWHIKGRWERAGRYDFRHISTFFLYFRGLSINKIFTIITLNDLKTVKFSIKYYYLVVNKEFRRRIGVFGGTFDPPHLGHTSAALFAMRELKLDFVLMVVANDPWQKTDPNRIAAESDSCLPSAVNHRYEMTKIAVDEYEALIADDMEIIRGGKTYTIDTLMELNNRFPASEFFLMIGSDVAKDFHLWRDPQSICNNANVVVLNRPGVNLSEIDENWKFTILEIPSIDVSSKEIRKQVSAAGTLEGMLSPEVKEYIFSTGLYQESN